MNTISAVLVVVTFLLLGLLWHSMNKKEPARIRRVPASTPPARATRKTRVPNGE